VIGDRVNPADEIRIRYEGVIERIDRAARKVGRDPAGVRLVVVTKLHPMETIMAAIQAGAGYLGENYAEEAVPKIQATAGLGVKWHMIGHLQGRKAGLVCEHFDYLHSLDSLRLAGRLSRLALENQRVLPVLLQFNVSGEASKSGWNAWQELSWPGLLGEVGEILALPGISVCGLMTMPPLDLDAESARPHFQRLKRLQGFLSQHFPTTSWDELSMGMSNDFEVAVQEGATWIRVGQAILGPRPG